MECAVLSCYLTSDGELLVRLLYLSSKFAFAMDRPWMEVLVFGCKFVFAMEDLGCNSLTSGQSSCFITELWKCARCSSSNQVFSQLLLPNLQRETSFPLPFLLRCCDSSHVHHSNTRPFPSFHGLVFILWNPVCYMYACVLFTFLDKIKRGHSRKYLTVSLVSEQDMKNQSKVTEPMKASS